MGDLPGALAKLGCFHCGGCEQGRREHYKSGGTWIERHLCGSGVDRVASLEGQTRVRSGEGGGRKGVVKTRVTKSVESEV